MRMENSITGTPDEASSRDQSAVQNSTFASKLKLAALWLAVGLPLLWGVMKTLEDGGSLPM
jgi:hypothetical protein